MRIAQMIDRLCVLEKTEANQLIEWCREQNFLQESYNGKTTKRFERWWGVGVRLYHSTHELYAADRVDPVIQKLANTFYPTANSFLLYRYDPGSGISEHTDRNCWYSKVVLINLVDASPNLFGDKPTIKFKFNGNMYLLSDGEIIQFDSSTPHGVPPIKNLIRYSLQLREVR